MKLSTIFYAVTDDANNTVTCVMMPEPCDMWALKQHNAFYHHNEVTQEATCELEDDKGSHMELR